MPPVTNFLSRSGVRLMGCLRQDDTAARLGGDEFAVCAEFDPSADFDLTALATRILDAFREPVLVGRQRTHRPGQHRHLDG